MCLFIGYKKRGCSVIELNNCGLPVKKEKKS
jgi:hypothetical protein